MKWKLFGWYMFVVTELWFMAILLLFTLGFIAFSTRRGEKREREREGG